MKDAPSGGVTTKTRTATKAVAAVAVLMLLGLAAYGFGFALGGPRRIVTTVNTTTAPTKATGGAQAGTTYTGGVAPTAPSICNLTETASGGGGRCYPTCNEKADCLKPGYVTAFADCAAKSVSICGDSKDCVLRVCGAETPDCVGGYCTRPDLALTQAQCPATPSQAVTVVRATADSCALATGSCYRSCASDSDCIDTRSYDLCVSSAAVKSACQKSALVGGLDQTCVTQMCGPKPTAVAGSCLKDSSGKPSYCATPVKDIGTRDSCLITVKVNDTITVDTGKRVWLGTCSVSGTVCQGDADCRGSAPRATGLTCDQSDAGCYRRCESDLACATGYDKYQACVSSAATASACGKTDSTGAVVSVDQACVAKRCGQAPAAKDGTCVKTGGNVPGHCSAPLTAIASQAACTPTVYLDGQQQATAGANVWLGACSNDATKSCVTASDCAVPAPVLPSSGKWVGVCPASSTTGTADCAASDYGRCSQPGATSTAGCDLSQSQCLRICSSDSDCQPDVKSCMAGIAKACPQTGDKSAYDACVKQQTANCQALGVCPKPTSTGAKSYCPTALVGSDAASCKTAGGVLRGTCATDATKRCSADSECAPTVTGAVMFPVKQ